MKWGNYDLYWGRPLKSILSLFDKKVIEFKLNHLQSSNKTFIDKDLEDEVAKLQHIVDDLNVRIKSLEEEKIQVTEERDYLAEFSNNLPSGGPGTGRPFCLPFLQQGTPFRRERRCATARLCRCYPSAPAPCPSRPCAAGRPS